jgi:hypothetical protein
VLDLQVINLVRKNGTSQRIAIGIFRAKACEHCSTRMSTTSSTPSCCGYASNGIRIIWPGSLLAVPTDIAVAAALDLQMIVIGAVVGAVLVALLVLAICLLRSHKEAAKRIWVSFVKHEGVLGVKLAWELWVREP